MSNEIEFKSFRALDYITTDEELDAYCKAYAEESQSDLAARYDEALKRINDLQAEVEHLRREVNRG